MKVTHVETVFVRPRTMFLKMYTDAGIVGLGEPALEGRTRTALAAVKEFEEYLVGKDPRHIEHHWQVMYRSTFYRGGPVLLSAISGFEQAMWDILGKDLGVPVYKLLGGPTRNRIRMYAHAHGDSPESCAQAAKARVSQGFTAIKTSFKEKIRLIDTPAMIDRLVADIAAMREAVGPEVDIAIDFHGRVSPAMSIRLCKELEPLRPLFVEEPVLPENPDALVTVARSTSIPIATGERLYTRWGYRDVIEKQAASVYQPDLSHAGGIMETKKIAAMAETYYAGIAPHSAIGPIALAACLHLDASIPNFLIQEHVTLGEGMLVKPIPVVDGYAQLPDKPGLGVEIDEEALAEHVYDGSHQMPQLFHDDDGSYTDW